MLCRAIVRPLHLLSLRNLTLTSSSSRLLHSSSPLLPPPPQPPAFPTPSPHSSWFLLQSLKPFSTTSRGDNGDGTWKFSPDSADDLGSVFGAEEGSLAGITEGGGGEDPVVADTGSGLKEEAEKDIFEGIQGEFAAAKEDVWETAERYRPWSLGDDGEKGDLFDVGEGGDGIEGIGDSLEEERSDELKMLEAREKELLATLKGPNRAFGDLIAASGITEDMIESLILLKDVRGIPGLPPLSEIEDKAIARMNATSSRAEIERKKQEEIAKSRVRQVDEKGRAYGTGRRKCSVARVWIQPGEGKFIVNDKEFDAYFPILDHRADLLRPFTETKTLGVWDVKCTVKGGGVSGQVGAIRLGISKALQNWEPGFRPYLKSAGYLTRDSRVVERKKPGKAKARKSFQWVKR